MNHPVTGPWQTKTNLLVSLMVSAGWKLWEDGLQGSVMGVAGCTLEP